MQHFEAALVREAGALGGVMNMAQKLLGINNDESICSSGLEMSGVPWRLSPGVVPFLSSGRENKIPADIASSSEKH